MVAVNGRFGVEAGSDGAKKMSRRKALPYQTLLDAWLAHASRSAAERPEC